MNQKIQSILLRYSEDRDISVFRTEAKRLKKELVAQEDLKILSVLKYIVFGYKSNLPKLTKILKKNWEFSGLHFWYQRLVFDGWMGGDDAITAASLEKIIEEKWYLSAPIKDFYPFKENVMRFLPDLYKDKSDTFEKLMPDQTQMHEQDYLIGRHDGFRLCVRDVPLSHLKLLDIALNDGQTFTRVDVDDVCYLLMKHENEIKLKIMPNQHSDSTDIVQFQQTTSGNLNQFKHKLKCAIDGDFNHVVYRRLASCIRPRFCDFERDLSVVTEREYLKLAGRLDPKDDKQSLRKTTHIESIM